MLCKILGQNDQSLALYQRLDLEIKEELKNKMKKSVFSVILISLQKDRKVSENILTKFSEEVSLVNPKDGYDE